MITGVSYFHTRDIRHVERDLDEMIAHGFNAVVHCYSELDMAFYNRAMEKIVRMTRDKGIEVYLDPWAFGGVYGGESFSRFVAEKLDARQIDNRGESVPAACLNNEEFRKFHSKWIKRAAELGAQVCFWDEPHFYFNLLDRSTWGTWCCRCNTCMGKYKDLYNEEMPTQQTGSVNEFRQKSALEFLTNACNEAKALVMRNCICVLPDEVGGIGNLSGTSSWEDIASIKTLDIFGTDPYWILFGKKLEEFVVGQSRRVIEICKKYDKEPQTWVLAFIIPEGREDEVGTAVELMHREGVRNIFAWGFRGCDVIDIQCKNPEKVWSILGDAFRKIRRSA